MRGVGYTIEGEKVKRCFVFVSERPMDKPIVRSSSALVMGAWPAAIRSPFASAPYESHGDPRSACWPRTFEARDQHSCRPHRAGDVACVSVDLLYHSLGNPRRSPAAHVAGACVHPRARDPHPSCSSPAQQQRRTVRFNSMAIVMFG